MVVRKNSRAGKLLATLPEGLLVPTEQLALLQAVAIMLAQATKKRITCTHECDETCGKKVRKRADQPKLPFTEAELIAQLPTEIAVTRSGPLTNALLKLDLLPDDLSTFTVWFTESMFPWMQSKDIDFTYSMLVRKLPEWLERARQYGGTTSQERTTENWR